MSIKNKILNTVLVILGVTSLFTENKIIASLSTIGMAIVIIIENITDYLTRMILIKKIKHKNMNCIKVKENNKVTILVLLLLILSMLISLKSLLNIYPIENYSIVDIINYINNFDYSYRMLIFTCIILFIVSILMIVQAIFSTSLVTDDKVIFYDGLIIDINKIEEIKYKEPLFIKNKKIIRIGKGFIDRNIIIKIEDFDKIKSLLESKIAF
ncbi:hypothetical protein EAI30_06515 [Romboutsia ilealis]|uniref:Uncharacterized protein n=1 Tax=Romboutsia faecis TaxID=2764597 RepID=A0ABR7JPG5_9FIRM|nr:hypothetical protein [Romboutsia faecis]MBC5996740.1 hypothetical protein [Romboutsia faecis]MRN24267.1 hypothetical protein [Romboutsia ilealis]